MYDVCCVVVCVVSNVCDCVVCFIVCVVVVVGGGGCVGVVYALDMASTCYKCVCCGLMYIVCACAR